MKGGRTPIHIMRWAPADYVNDAFVRLLVAEEDFATLTLYHLVLNWSHMEGGDLPADPRQLGAVVGMKCRRVEKCLARCVEAGKLHIEEGRVFHSRVVREVAQELEYRDLQSERGKLGGRPKSKANAKPPVSDPVKPAVAVAVAVAKRQAPSPDNGQRTTDSRADARPNGAPPAARETWLTGYGEDWRARWGVASEPPFRVLAGTIRAAHEKYGEAALRAAWRAYLASETEAKWAKPATFVQGLGQWLGPRPALAPARASPRTTSSDRTMAAVARFVERRRQADGEVEEVAGVGAGDREGPCPPRGGDEG